VRGRCQWLKGIKTIESEETTVRSSLAASEKQIEHLTVVRLCHCLWLYHVLDYKIGHALSFLLLLNSRHAYI